MNFTMIDRVCPVCEQVTDGHVFTEANVEPGQLDAFAFASRKIPEYMHWRIVECGRCDLLYSSPIPEAGSLGVLYNDAAFDSGEEARYAARTYARFLPRLKAELPDLNGTLDIGTGDGAFLEELLAAGFTAVEGVEPSAAPVAAAPPAVRPLIRHEMFRRDRFAAGSFSLVTCFQTIEHLADPLAMCRDAFELLKPGGALFLIGHNRRAAANRLMGERSPILDVEHLQLFSPRSVRFMVEKAGFGGVRVKTFLNRYPLNYWMRLLPIPRRLKERTIRLSARLGVGRLGVPLPAGNMAIIAFKPL